MYYLEKRPQLIQEAIRQLINKRFFNELEDRLDAATGFPYVLTDSKSRYNLKPIYCLSLQKN